MPWELGLAETQQTLLLNGLRDRITVQVDGQMKTGRDVVVAALLGAEEFGFATAPLVVSGCVMMRVCHLDTCPVGVATQNPELRKRYTGKPEFVVTFFEYVAEQVRELLAELGFRSLDEAIGHAELLDTRAGRRPLEGRRARPRAAAGRAASCRPARRGSGSRGQDHGLDEALDNTLIQLCEGALLDAAPVHAGAAGPQRQPDRRHHARLAGHPAVRRGRAAGRHHRHHLHRLGRPVVRRVPAARASPCGCYGDANDYVGKGLSGGRIVGPARPRRRRSRPSDNVIAGNVHRATARPSGELYLRGVGRGAVLRPQLRARPRSSRASATTRCEYMTGGRVVILGATGRNLGGRHVRRAGVRARPGPGRVNPELVDLEPVPAEDAGGLRAIVAPARAADRLAGRGRAAGRLGRGAGPVHRGRAARLQAGAGGHPPGRARTAARVDEAIMEAARGSGPRPDGCDHAADARLAGQALQQGPERLDVPALGERRRRSPAAARTGRAPGCGSGTPRPTALTAAQQLLAWPRRRRAAGSRPARTGAARPPRTASSARHPGRRTPGPARRRSGCAPAAPRRRTSAARTTASAPGTGGPSGTCQSR